MTETQPDSRGRGKYSKIIRDLEGHIKALEAQTSRMLTEKDEEIERLRTRPLTDEQVKHMADRFLGWRLPDSFNPDGGISFKKTFNDHLPTPSKHEPLGTNLFDATQADAMVRYLIDGMPAR